MFPTSQLRLVNLLILELRLKFHFVMINIMDRVWKFFSERINNNEEKSTECRLGQNLDSKNEDHSFIWLDVE